MLYLIIILSITHHSTGSPQNDIDKDVIFFNMSSYQKRNPSYFYQDYLLRCPPDYLFSLSMPKFWYLPPLLNTHNDMTLSYYYYLTLILPITPLFRPFISN